MLLSVLPWLLSNARFHAHVDTEGIWPNPECAVGSAWHAAGVWRRVKRYPRTMFAIRRRSEARNWMLAAGRSAPQRCRPHTQLAQFRSRAKYCSEQWKAEAGCAELIANASRT